MIDWDKFQRDDLSYDLDAIWSKALLTAGLMNYGARKFLQNVEAIRPINSRQVAAVALAHAMEIAEAETNGR